ncbi:phosphotransferase [Paenibacillus sp. PDC88]|uniref:phosphotransferase n=1 Tax=Paenibacillus sp. PDC88 TaxID=1884375 RepID=UPI00089A46BD|nr:phosphotransferase [Paenibacillus sp. PDC88]SDX43035.1 Ser/Thr protein kinase RdoA involved in Cpx stress response, MazF antagonist [Paenibacillus sp. PDC88]
MNIERYHLEEILSAYGIKNQITDTHDYIKQYSVSDTPRVKAIIRADFIDRPSVVVKMIKQKEHPRWKMEQQSIFSEHMRRNGILTPKRYISKEQYCISVWIENVELDVILEDYLGEEIRTIDVETVGRIGQLMARMHIISERDDCHIDADSIFNVTGYNEASGYERFRELGEAGYLNQEKYERIIQLYEDRMNRIQAMWPELPRHATQGDYSINNLVLRDGAVGIFDYNIAGDETLVGDLIVEGLLVANEMDLAEGLSTDDRPQLFNAFYDGYSKVRPLQELEQAVVKDVYAVVASMWFTTIRYEEDSLEFMVERHEVVKMESILDQMLELLSEAK